MLVHETPTAEIWRQNERRARPWEGWHGSAIRAMDRGARARFRPEEAPSAGMKPSALRQLSPELQSKLRSCTVISSIGQLVEECVCNSIDAGATKVSVVVDTGSTLAITVSDNGRGMSVRDVRDVGRRYHTSKCHDLQDLSDNIKTLGFRGEALASMSDLSVLEVTSRAAGSFETYTRISTKAGTATLACGPARYQLPKAGTVITARDLFHNHPVRRNMIRRNLQKQLDDARARVYRLALIHPAVGVSLTEFNGRRKELMRLPPGRSLLSALSDAFGSALASSLVPVGLTVGPFRARGYVTPSNRALNSPEVQFLYVNRRFVKKTPLHKAVKDAFNAARDPYESRRGPVTAPPGGHPGYVLCLDCSPSEYDVTYDVEKTLIEFRDWEMPLRVLNEALREAWPPIKEKEKEPDPLEPPPQTREPPVTPPPAVAVGGTETPSKDANGNCICCPPLARRRLGVPSMGTADDDDAFICQTIEPFEDAPPPQQQQQPQPPNDVRSLLATWKNPVPAEMYQPSMPSSAANAVVTRESLENATVLTQWGKKFVLIRSASGDLFALDQHASDERLRLENLRRDLTVRGDAVTSKVLPHPVPCELSAAELATLRANASSAHRWGWRWEDDDAGGGGVSLTGTPAIEGTTLGGEALGEYLREIAAVGLTSAPPPALHRLLASKACRGAIMFGDMLRRRECVALLEELRKTQLPLQCAHGRPTAALLAPGAVVDEDAALTPRNRRKMLAAGVLKTWRASQEKKRHAPLKLRIGAKKVVRA